MNLVLMSIYVNKGHTAPDFSVIGIRDDEKVLFDLYDTLDDGKYVVLFFYPADFSPVCTPEMCAIRDAEFFEFTQNVVPWGISGDSTYAHRSFAEQYNLDFPLLADTDRSVAELYGVRYDEWEGHRGGTKRGVFLIDPERKIRYAWQSEDAYVEPELWPLKEALDTVIAEDKLAVESSTDGLKPVYDDGEIEKLD